MKILAIEFSSAQRSVAVVAAPGLPATAGAQPAGTGRPAVLSAATGQGDRPTKAFALIETALHEANTPREEVECLAVGLGPGSYAGIRVAIALAQGWQLARNVKLLGLSSADAVAAQARDEGMRGRVQVAIDAQRREVYLAEYDLGETKCRELMPLRLAPMAEVQTLADAGAVIIGPEAEQWCKAGRTVFPTAKQLALLAAGRTDYVAGEQLEPIYLRPVSFVKAPPPRAIGG
jgi:tRNA threonylcarbamoyl adenosine modification protein YeaZ